MYGLFIISTEMLLANLFLWDRCAKRRYSIAATVFCYILFRICMILLGGWMKSGRGGVYNDGPWVILAGFLYIIPIFFLYETRILKLINIFFFLWTYTFALYCISYFSSQLLLTERQMFLFVILQTLLYVLTFPYYYTQLIPKYSYMIDHISKKDESGFTVLSASWFLVLFALYNILTLPELIIVQVIVFLPFLAIVVISSRLIYNLVITRNQMLQLSMRYDHQLAQYQEQRRHIAEIRKVSHDINKYTTVIQYALKERNYDYLAEFCESAFETLQPQLSFQETGNETLDALLYHLSNQCQEKKIDLTFTLDPAANGSIKLDPLDLTSILGNLFENAVEACEDVEEALRWISVELRNEDIRIRLTVRNSCTQLKKNNRQGMKRMLPKHIGMTIVERTVKKIGGMVTHQKKENQYEVVLLIANKNPITEERK